MIKHGRISETYARFGERRDCHEGLVVTKNDEKYKSNKMTKIAGGDACYHIVEHRKVATIVGL